MNKSVVTIATMLLVTLAVTESAHALPSTMSFAGRLTDDSGPVTGSVNVEVRLYDSAGVGGGTQVWAETHAVAADNGLVYIALGSKTALDETVFDGRDLWLDIVVNGAQQSPRVAIHMVPYAAHAAVAQSADTLGTLRPEDVALAGHDHDAAYAAKTHDHDGDYAAAGHNHSGVYAPANHNHNGVYAPASHDHDTRYASASHNHDARYASLSHDHDARYARTNHDHAGVYAPTSHNHSAASITSGTLSTDRFDAYADLTAAGRLNADTGTDLVTRSQGDARYAAAGHSHGTFQCSTVQDTTPGEIVEFETGSSAATCPAGDVRTGGGCRLITATAAARAGSRIVSSYPTSTTGYFCRVSADRGSGTVRFAAVAVCCGIR